MIKGETPKEVAKFVNGKLTGGPFKTK